MNNKLINNKKIIVLSKNFRLKNEEKKVGIFFDFMWDRIHFFTKRIRGSGSTSTPLIWIVNIEAYRIFLLAPKRFRNINKFAFVLHTGYICIS